METSSIIILFLIIFGHFLFYFNKKFLWVGLALLANLGLFGILSSGNWPLLLFIGIPISILNYFAYCSIKENLN